MPKSKSLGSLGDMIGEVKEPSDPVTLESLSRRVASVESVLATVIEELTDISEKVQRLSTPRPKAKATPKRGGKPTGGEKPTPTPTPKRKNLQPWDNPEIRKDIEACRPKILQLLSNEQEVTKAGCAEKLGVDASLVGRTLSYMMSQKKEITMITPPPTEADPDPKKLFRRK